MSYSEGKYIFRVTAQGFDKSKDKGTPFFFLTGEPIARQDGEYLDPVTPQTRTISLYLTEKSAEQSAGKLEAIGWTGGSWTNLDPAKPGHQTFVGLEIEALCKLEDYKGKMREKWELPWDNDGPQNTPEVAAKMDALFGRAAQAVKKAAKPKAKGNAALSEAANQDAPAPPDEIPF